MAEKRVATATATPKKEIAKKPYHPLFEKENLVWMLIGGVVIALGMILMAGGKSTDPNVFDSGSIYSTRRITIAPILILLGFVIEIYAIFKRPKVQP